MSQERVAVIAHERLAGTMSQAIDGVDAQIMLRHRAESKASMHHVNATHPPTARHIEMLRQCKPLDAAVAVTTQQNRQIEDEPGAPALPSGRN